MSYLLLPGPYTCLLPGSESRLVGAEPISIDCISRGASQARACEEAPPNPLSSGWQTAPTAVAWRVAEDELENAIED
jgi:hypothetical protein